MSAPTRPRGSPWAVIVFAVTTLLFVVALVLQLRTDQLSWLQLLPLPVIYTFALVGILIALSRPGNRVAWLCLAIGFAFALEELGWAVAVFAEGEPESLLGSPLWAVFGDSLILPGIYTILTLLLLWFPDGRLPSPRWRWVERLAILAIVAAFAISLFSTERIGWGRPQIHNPLAPRQGSILWQLTNSTLVDLLILPVLIVVVVGSLAALVTRYRSSRGVERQQLKWFAFAGSVVALSLLFAILAADYLGDDFGLAVTGSLILIPLSIGGTILRFRLYDIDRLISRTVTYAVVVGAIATIYAAIAIWLPQVVGLTGESPLLVAAATLAVAALFNPIRRRAKHGIDRQFNRSQRTAELEIEAFTERLHDQMTLEEISAGVTGVVVNTMQPAGASIWVRQEPSS